MKQLGFTLLEIILALSILGTIGIITINILSDQIITRQKLSELNVDHHTLDAAMQRLVKDIQGAYLLDLKYVPSFNINNRPVVPQFYFKGGNLIFFTTAHHSFISGSNESNQASIRYYTAPKTSKLQLIRVVDTEFLNNIEGNDVGLSQILIDDLESFKVMFWNDSDFIEDWDSRTSESSGKLPKMVKIHLSVYSSTKQPQLQTNQDKKNRKANALDTIVYLDHAAESAITNSSDLGEYKWQ